MSMNAHDYVAGLVEKARKAQAIANDFTQEDVDLITAAVTYNLTKPEKANLHKSIKNFCLYRCPRDFCNRKNSKKTEKRQEKILL